MPSRSTKIEDWSHNFRNILELERANGFNDRAVIGGMDGFVRHWSESMATCLGNPRENRQLLRPGYARMTSTQRSEWVQQWLQLLKDGSSGPVPTTEKSLPEKTGPISSRSTRKSPATLKAASDASSVITLDSPISDLKRVNSRTADQLARLDINTLRDLVYHFPHRHIDYSRRAKASELWPGQELTVVGQITESREAPLGRSRRKATEAVLTDDTGSVRVTWFNQGFLARTLKPGTNVAISGKVDSFNNRPVFESPEYDILRPGQEAVSTGRLVPVYPLTAGLTGRNLRGLTWQVLRDFLKGMEETAPDEMLSRTSLLPLATALQQAHYPESLQTRDRARRRLAFDELLTLQLSVLSRRQREVGLLEGVSIDGGPLFLDGFLSGLPFSLTGAQRRCLDEILGDMARGTPPMNRLLQGEVGSGKTVVALIALLTAISRGYQGAIMVPTEVLAEQHFQTVTRLLGGMADATQSENLLTVYLEALGRPMTVGLLTGSTRARPRNRLKALAAEGTLDLLIGTHALIQEGVEMPRLALAVMDEQHRFGVMQRSALRQKSEENPHTLVMSATPIPRTLTLTLYGDLDVSVIDKVPPGRQEVQTRYVDPERREAAYGFIRRQINDGRQAFIICPLVEESEVIEAKAASDEHQRLSREVFPDLKLGLLHGRMPAAEKDKIMRQFRDGELEILVSTAVVEVGIDVPNATVMLIEGADRFGLSQLHQFRGRVGRGEHKSYCILMSENPSGPAQERLSALERTRDGFELAEIDLNLRGPGDFFGTRQSGLPALRMAQLSDRDLLDLARQEAMRIMEEDPDLELDRHAGLSAQVARFMQQVSGEMS
jgi:ATP-dependent DNA helicase RecG